MNRKNCDCGNQWEHNCNHPCPPCIQCPSGAQGPQGPRGFPGQGLPGPSGPAGSSIIGPSGAAGVGVSGPSGTVGPSGGPPGPSGPSGAASIVPGPSGPAGLDGVSGPSGADSIVPGPSGPSGPSGSSGPSGPSGPSGSSGPSGPSGSTGSAGVNGAGAIIPIASGIVNTFATASLGTTTVVSTNAVLGFGFSFMGPSIALGNPINLSTFGAGGNMAFVVPRSGHVTAIYAHFTNTITSAIVMLGTGTTPIVNIIFQLYYNNTPTINDTFAPQLPQTVTINLPLQVDITGLIYTLPLGFYSGMNVNSLMVSASDRLLLGSFIEVIPNGGSIVSVADVTGYLSAGLEIDA
jgi:BclB C-terminal domain-containing protein